MIADEFLQGQSMTAYEYFGAHFCKGGVRFATYAPNAKNVVLMLNGGEFSMDRDERGIWKTTLPDVKQGDIYQFIITTQALQKHYRSDPFAFYSEVRPLNASRVYDVDRYKWKDREWLNRRDKCYDKPMNIYEVHFGSWRVKYDDPEDDGRLYSYDEMTDKLIPYVKDMGYTHIELMPLTEYPFDGSWGYQVTGYFAATSRYGEPEGLMRFIDACHENGIGVILDFVPVHFVTDFYALHIYDGGFLFESDRESERFSEWGTALFDYSKPHVLSFVKSAVNFWIEKYHVDGIRMDAVANLIYKHGRKDAPINDSGIWFLKNTNYAIQKRHPEVMLFAEDSTDYEKVTAPVEFGGLGFDYKWDLGFMHDTINYVKTPPYERRAHHNKMTFSMSYYYNNLYILPYSHDEVVHGKQTMLDKCFGKHEEKIATVKVLYTFQFGHPGKKLNFMGNEIAEYMEWRPDKELGWNLLTYPAHDSVHQYLKKLHHIYLSEPALYENDYNSSFFRWIDANNNDQSVYSFCRKDKYGRGIYMVFNFSGISQRYFLRVEENGDYYELLNSDQDIYAGSNCLNGDMRSYNYGLNIQLAPLSCAIIKKKF
ncbi:MAG: 1,4-alpha-glucan branching protein GlgB [Ruminococcus sp.]|nr:1,4-alpha-glucan branching protein GlgB [Ruminococcus sp.]